MTTASTATTRSRRTDYWDFIGALVDHRQCVALKEVA